MSETKRVLVVEDDPLVSDIIAAALDDRYVVTVVETSAKALASLREGNIGVMLLDCTLPGGITPELLPMAEQAGAAVVLMSGDPSRGEALSERPRAFLRKPFTISGLLGAVASAWEVEASKSAE